MPTRIRSPAVRKGFFSNDGSPPYEPDQDVFGYPNGATRSPRYRGKSHDNVIIDYTNRDAYKAYAEITPYSVTPPRLAPGERNRSCAASSRSLNQIVPLRSMGPEPKWSFGHRRNNF